MSKKLRVYCWGRQTGKTTEIVKYLQKSCLLKTDAVMFVMNRSLADSVICDYPELKGRVFTHTEPLKGHRIKKVLIDEVDFMPTEKLIELIKNHNVVAVYGTPQWHSPNFSWLSKFCVLNKKTSLETIKPRRIKELKKNLGEFAFKSEILAEFKERANASVPL